MRFLLVMIFSVCFTAAFASDSAIIKVHFLYGSKPAKHFRETEPRWFGGVLGGHVGIETGDEAILNFLKTGKLHLVAKAKNKHSRFAIHNVPDFYAIFGGKPDSIKKTVVTIPISAAQKEKIDSISTEYLHQTPYDYAFIGMRCGAAAYEILGQLNILPAYKKGKTVTRIFYPKKLRKRLLGLAKKNNWPIDSQPGSAARKWEQD